MKTNEFLDLLRNNSGKELQFAYNAGSRVPVNYHLTEVKNVSVESLDCGANLHTYYETVIQIYNPVKDLDKGSFTAHKALGILDKVAKVKPFRADAEIRFEYGHGDLRTSVYNVGAVEETDSAILLNLFAPPTVCKPKEAAKGKLKEAFSCC